MRILNVITEQNESIEIESFLIVDEQQSDEVIEEAHEFFREKIVACVHEDIQTEAADDIRNEVEENWIDEGQYIVGDGTVIWLVWSYPNNI